MVYPILAPNSTWFAPNDTTITRPIFTEIELVDSYTPDASVTVRDSWDASAAKDGSITCYVIGTKLFVAGNGSGKIAANEDSSDFLFGSLSNCFKNIVSFNGASLLDTSKTKNMDSMFYGSESLLNLDISNWDTSNVTNMSSMFQKTKSISKVIGLSDIDTSNVTDMSYMFSYSSIEEIPNFNTSNVETVKCMFQKYAREEFIAPSWDFSKVKTMCQMFGGDPNGGEIKHINLNNLKNTFNVEDFSGLCMFQTQLKTLHMENLQVLSSANFGSFIKNTPIKEIYFPKSGLKLNSYSGLFNGASALEILDVSDWDVSNVTDMSFMFYNCSSLKEIDVSKWDVSKVQNFDHFAAHANLRRKGIENWDTSSATNMNAMFHNCAEEELDLSGFDTSKVQFFSQMFENSPNLKHIKGLDKWDTSNAVGFDEMFGRCYKLEELDLSSWDTSKAKSGVEASTNGHTTGTFRNFCNDCVNLKWIKLGPNFAINGDGTNANAEYKLILPTPSTDNIEEADGNWYAFNGDSFAPNAIPDRTANTYYSSYDAVVNSDVILKNSVLLNIASAIKEKNGTTTKYHPSQFAEAIRSL